MPIVNDLAKPANPLFFEIVKNSPALNSILCCFHRMAYKGQEIFGLFDPIGDSELVSELNSQNHPLSAEAVSGFII